VKGQQLFHSFLPGVTAAVLSTQPALASTIKISRVQLVSPPKMENPTFGRNVVTDGTIGFGGHLAIAKPPLSLGSITQSFLPQRDKLIAQTVTFDHTPVEQQAVHSNQTELQPVNDGKSGGLAFGQTPATPENITGDIFKLSTEKIPNQSTGKFSHLAAENQPNLRDLARIGQKLNGVIIPVTPITNANFLSYKKNSSRSNSQQIIAQAANFDNSNLAINQQAQECLKAGKKSPAALLLKPNICLQKIASSQQIAQATDTPAPAGTTEFTTPTPTTPTPTEPVLIKPVPVGDTNVPESLKPNANPLLYPTKPEEVTIQANQPITLEQAIEIAKRNNNELQVSILELKRSQFALREQQAELFPDLQISGQVDNSRSVSSSLQVDRAKNTNPNISDAPSDTSFSGQAQLTYDIYTSGRRLAAIKEAEERSRFQELAVENKEEDIRLDVSTRYYDLQQADEQVRIAQSAVENAQASLRDAQALERAGVGTRFDVLRSQVNLANSQQELTNAISNQLVARRRLATLLNLPQSINISAADPAQLAGLWNQTLEQSIVLAYQNRAELQQQLLQRNISEQQRRQALATLGPQISLFARYDLLDVFNDNTRVSDGYSFGVRASLNLFDGGAARARSAQARTNIEIAETQFSEQRNQIRFQVEQAYATQQSNLENVQTANAALEQAKEALRLARLRFQAGVGTQTDVINAENDLTRSEGNRIRAILDYNRALIQLQRYVTFRALSK
jgi:OMF family outer membrane factor